MADVDLSLLHLPRKMPPSDSEAYLRAAIAWHFDQGTGSPYWLRTAKNLDFNPLTDITTFNDLRLFPNLESVPRVGGLRIWRGSRGVISESCWTLGDLVLFGKCCRSVFLGDDSA